MDLKLDTSKHYRILRPVGASVAPRTAETSKRDDGRLVDASARAARRSFWFKRPSRTRSPRVKPTHPTKNPPG
jgi:hypothetical protein